MVDEPDAADEDDLSPPERATLLVQRLHGAEGLRALATFMHAMGAEALLTYPDPDDETGGPVWTPCDFVMQHCWELGATPAPRPDSPPPTDAVVQAREARDAYRKIVESSRPSGQPNGRVVPWVPLRHWLGDRLDRLCAALGVDDAGPRAGAGEGQR